MVLVDANLADVLGSPATQHVKAKFMVDRHYDVVVIGSGPGGATLAQRLAPSGKRILILERGDFLERSIDNWNPRKVFIENIYQANETWYDKHGNAFHPGLHYFVGGNSKMYGRGPVPVVGARLRGVATRRRRIPGMAAEVRRVRAVLRRS